eukprot:1051898-Amphidinium_carterae.1
MRRPAWIRTPPKPQGEAPATTRVHLVEGTVKEVSHKDSHLPDTVHRYPEGALHATAQTSRMNGLHAINNPKKEQSLPDNFHKSLTLMTCDVRARSTRCVSSPNRQG